jgi:transaldolase
MKIKIYADGADYKSIIRLNKSVNISGFTTNPTLMRKSGVKDYSFFAKKVLKQVKNKPISFEVFSDDFQEMKKQARIINSWGSNVYVKIPICNTKGESTVPLIAKLSSQKIKINVTAMMSFEQAKNVIDNVHPGADIILSVFAGRIADTGRDPEDIMTKINNYIIQSKKDKFKTLWASVREIFNLFQAERTKTNIITLTPEILDKIKLRNKDLHQYSIETAKMFYEDGLKNSLNI